MSAPLRIGVLGSGKGSNFRAIDDAIARGELNVDVRIVISDVENAGSWNSHDPAEFMPSTSNPAGSGRSWSLKRNNDWWISSEMRTSSTWSSRVTCG